jgi:hypothetical protein
MAGRLLALLPEQWAAEVARSEAGVTQAVARILSGQARLGQVRQSGGCL